MREAADAEMRADEAADLLAGLEGFEEELTARTAGLTWFVWGLAIPGLFLTYAALEPLLAQTSRFAWVEAFLWFPWILSGSLATNALWSTNAVTLDRESARSGWGTSLGFLATFFLIAGALWALSGLGVPGLAGDAIWILAGGLLTIAIGTWAHRLDRPGGGVTVLGGVAIVAGALGLAWSQASPALVDVAGAGLVGLVYHAIGGWLYRQG